MELYEYIYNKMGAHRRNDFILIIEDIKRTSRFFSSEFIITTRAQMPIAANSIVVEWFMEEYNPKRQSDIVEWLLTISDIDEEWTKKRNGLYIFPLFYKAHLKKEASEFIVEHIAEAVKKLEVYIFVPEAAVKSELSGWRRVSVVDLKSPSRDTDGYLEAVYENKSGERIQMVYTNIPDFCLYAYPSRLKGATDFLVRSKWSEQERELAVWITKNEEFR